MSTENDNYAMESTSQKTLGVLNDNNREFIHQSSGDRDQDELARTGKKQVLKVCSQTLVYCFQNTTINNDSVTSALYLCWDSVVLC